MDQNLANLVANRVNASDALLFIRDSIDNGAPLSFVRFNDGEAAILGATNEVDRSEVEFFFSHWWAQTIQSWDDVFWLRDELIKSAEASTVCGFFDESLDKRPLKFLRTGRLLRTYGDLTGVRKFVTADAHLEWQDSDLLSSILTGKKHVHVICCYDVSNAIMKKFGIRQVSWIPIPGHAKYLPSISFSYPHFKARMEEVFKVLDRNCQDQIFLVGAGVLGKIYCRLIMQAGGVALDLGSVFDNWVGNTKRTSVQQHRQGI